MVSGVLTNTNEAIATILLPHTKMKKLTIGAVFVFTMKYRLNKHA
jgi:hypothetical protein